MSLFFFFNQPQDGYVVVPLGASMGSSAGLLKGELIGAYIPGAQMNAYVPFKLIIGIHSPVYIPNTSFHSNAVFYGNQNRIGEVNVKVTRVLEGNQVMMTVNTVPTTLSIKQIL